MDDSEPFYMPSPSLFAHSDAYRLYTGYATRLEAAGLADRFPVDADERKVAIELLAERYAAPRENLPRLSDGLLDEFRLFGHGLGRETRD